MPPLPQAGGDTAAPAPISAAELLSGQELFYRGRYGAAHLYFLDLAARYPDDAAPPVLAASAFVWWAEARDEETWMADSVDVLLDSAVVRARGRVDRAVTGAQRSASLYWLGTALGLRARQAELRGATWRAAREARDMRDVLTEAAELDSTCVDCLLGIAAYHYGIARAGFLARTMGRLFGFGGGDPEAALALMRRVGEDGSYARIEARWLYVHSLLREGLRDQAQREEGLRLAGALARQFPENEVFRRAADPQRVIEP